jgi:uncharacterized protein YqeY
MRNTMTLKERLKDDVVVRMKSGNKVALTTVRNVLGEIETKEKSGKTPVELDDLQVTSLLQKEAAKRRDTAGTYQAAGHEDRAQAEIAEAEVIEAYLPKALTREEVEAIVDEVITGLKADGACHPQSLRPLLYAYGGDGAPKTSWPDLPDRPSAVTGAFRNTVRHIMLGSRPRRRIDEIGAFRWFQPLRPGL